MKILFRFLTAISLILIISSCIRVVYINKKFDPEITLKKEHHTILFVNLFDYTSRNLIAPRDRQTYHNGVMGLLEGLTSFAEDSSFTFLVADTLKKGIDKSSLTTLLPADTISAMCRRESSNYLLALDSLSVHFEADTTGATGAGQVDYSVKYQLFTDFFISMYTSEGDLVDRSVVGRSQLFRVRPLIPGVQIVKPALSRVKYETGYLAYQSGQDYVNKYFSGTIVDTKQLYTGKAFRESNKLIFQKDWPEAIHQLKELTGNSDPDIARKAKHNLDVAVEASEAKEH